MKRKKEKIVCHEKHFDIRDEAEKIPQLSPEEIKKLAEAITFKTFRPVTELTMDDIDHLIGRLAPYQIELTPSNYVQLGEVVVIDYEEMRKKKPELTTGKRGKEIFFNPADKYIERVIRNYLSLMPFQFLE